MLHKHAWLQTKSIFVSAGHSDADPGAVGNGFTEADVVLEFRDLVAIELRRLGMHFVKDGSPGENLPLRDAIRLAAARDIAVEFHCNAFSNPRATGVETLSGSEHFEEGEALCRTVSNILGIANRGAKGEASGQHSRLGFIRDGNGIILELFFITNPTDVERYQGRKHVLAQELALVLAELACDPVSNSERLS